MIKTREKRIKERKKYKLSVLRKQKRKEKKITLKCEGIKEERRERKEKRGLGEIVRGEMELKKKG